MTDSLQPLWSYDLRPGAAAVVGICGTLAGFSLAVLTLLLTIERFKKLPHIGSFTRPLMFSFVWLLIAAFEFLMVASEAAPCRRGFMEIVFPEFHTIIGALLMVFALLRVTAGTIFIRSRWSVLLAPLILLGLYGRGVVIKAMIDYEHIRRGLLVIDLDLAAKLFLSAHTLMVPAMLLALFTLRPRKTGFRYCEDAATKVEVVVTAAGIVALALFGSAIMTPADWIAPGWLVAMIVMSVLAAIDWILCGALLILFVDAGEPHPDFQKWPETRPPVSEPLEMTKIGEVTIHRGKRNPTAALLVIHGIGYRGEPYGRHLAPHLVSDDVAIATFDLPGHGQEGVTSLTAMPPASECRTRIDNALRLVRQALPEARLFLVGESMGASVLADWFDAREGHGPSEIAGAAFVVPVFRPNPFFALDVHSLGMFAKGLLFPRRPVIDLAGVLLGRAFGGGEQPGSWLDERRRDTRAARHVSVRYLLAIAKLSRVTRQQPWGTRTPALFVHGRDDNLADPHAAQIAASGWLDPRREFAVLPAGHCMWFKPEQQPELAGLLREWIRRVGQS